MGFFMPLILIFMIIVIMYDLPMVMSEIYEIFSLYRTHKTAFSEKRDETDDNLNLYGRASYR